MNIKLLTEHHLEFLSLKGGCTGLSESVHVKMPHCWKSYVAAHCHIHRSEGSFFTFQKLLETKVPVLKTPTRKPTGYNLFCKANRKKLEILNPGLGKLI